VPPATEPVERICYRGKIEVRPYRRGTYLGEEHLEALVERTLAPRYRFGEGWRGFAVVSIDFYDEPPPEEEP
jgi:hypothetical protein